MTSSGMVATWSARERSELFEQTAAGRNLTAVLVEKDYWVCWALDVLFSGALQDALVFKGGTSLSKVYGAIHRFSEDIDLCVSRSHLGVGADVDPYSATSNRHRREQVNVILSACNRWIASDLVPHFVADAAAILGPDGFSAKIDEHDLGTVNFGYPRSLAAGRYGAGNYLAPSVKLELGARGEGVPASPHTIQSICAQAFPEVVGEHAVRVVALSAERTFWEKVLFAHAEYHRPNERRPPEHSSRHYYDLAMLARNGTASRALAEPRLCADVVRNTSTFFERSWGRYETAAPGTFRIVPSQERTAALRNDYSAMKEMFFSPEPTFDELIIELEELEHLVNDVG